jgi:hypothetical protein
MTDRELLELAALAAGGEVNGWQHDRPYVSFEKHATLYTLWNPLTDDGDALRLAVKLRLSVQINDASIVIGFNQDADGNTRSPLYEYPDTDQDGAFDIHYINHDKATRFAIVRAAAEIGKRMKGEKE